MVILSIKAAKFGYKVCPKAIDGEGDSNDKFNVIYHGVKQYTNAKSIWLDN